MMNNPMMGGMNPMQIIQQIKANPMQFLRRGGFNIPQNMNDPNAIIQHLMNSGQITQQQYDNARNMVARFWR